MVSINYSMICSSQASSTALIRLHSLGDVVIAQPVASELSRNSEVLFITSPKYVPVIERMGSRIHPVAVPEGSGPLSLRRILRNIAPGSVIDLQNNLTTRIATAGKPVRGRFRTDRKLRRKVLSHEEESMPLRSSEYLESAGFKIDLDPVLEKRSSAESGGLRIGIVTGGRWPLKSIPESVVSEVSRVLIDLHEAEIVLIGGSEDRELVQRTAESASRKGVGTYWGSEGIEGLIEVIENLDVLVSPDSGPAHLASALGIPVLVVFTSTSPSLGFWKQGRRGNYMLSGVSCRPCHRHGGSSCHLGTQICRKGLLPWSIAEAAMELQQS
jgi:heptosyltransferase II